MKSALRLTLPLLTFGAILAGCSQRNEFKLPEFPNPLASRDEKPKRSIPIHDVVCVWKHAEGQNKHNSPCRGVAGQILFFKRGSKSPVRIDDESDVVIYMFHDQGTPEEQAVPITKYTFTGNSWNAHLGVGQLGPTYQVFLPYDRKTVHQVKVTLSLRVIAKDRRPFSSRPDTVTLYGPIKNSDGSSFSKRIEPGVNSQKTGVSSFGARSKENAFANLGNKIQSSATRSPQQRPSDSHAKAAADSLLRKHGFSPGQPLPQNGVRQAAGRRDVEPASPAADRPLRMENFLNRRDQPRVLPRSTNGASEPLEGTGFQLHPAAGAATASHRQSATRERRQPANIVQRPLGDVRRAPLASPPSASDTRTRHPLEGDRGSHDGRRGSFSNAPTYRHPLNRDASPSRRFFPKDAAWNPAQKFDTRPATPQAFDERRAETSRNFDDGRNQHPLNGARGDTGTDRSRHPLADGVVSRRSFR